MLQWKENQDNGLAMMQEEKNSNHGKNTERRKCVANGIEWESWSKCFNIWHL